MAAAWMRAGVLDRVVTARIYNAYGPDMGADHVIPQLILRILAMSPAEDLVRVLGSGWDRRSFIWTEDCTAQLLRLYESAENGSYDVGDPSNEVAIGDLAELIGLRLEHQVRVVPDAPCTTATLQVPKVCDMLAPIPRTDFGVGLLRTAEWYKEHQEEFK
jgi:nucleoside-diphosphate-sugar epimerase